METKGTENYGIMQVPCGAERRKYRQDTIAIRNVLHNSLVKFFSTPKHHLRRRRNLRERIVRLIQAIGKKNIPKFHLMHNFKEILQKQRMLLARRMMALGSAEEGYPQLLAQAKKIDLCLSLIKESESTH